MSWFCNAIPNSQCLAYHLPQTILSVLLITISMISFLVKCIYSFENTSNGTTPPKTTCLYKPLFYNRLHFPKFALSCLAVLFNFITLVLPIFSIKNEEGDYDDLHPEDRYFLSPCELILTCLLIFCWGLIARYVSYSKIIRISCIILCLCNIGFGSLFISYWRNYEFKTPSIRYFRLCYFVVSALFLLLEIGEQIFCRHKLALTKEQMKAEKFLKEGLVQKMEWEALYKKKNVKSKYNELEKSGVINRLTFKWILPMMKRGYKKPLELDELAELPLTFDAYYLYLRMKSYYKKFQPKNPNSKFTLLKSLVYSLKHEIICNTFVCLFPVSLCVLFPTFINSFISYFESNEPVIKGIFLCIAFGTYLIMNTILWNYVDLNEFIIMSYAQAAIFRFIYGKTLYLSEETKEEGHGKIINHFSMDAFCIIDGILDSKNTLILIIWTMVGMGYLYYYIGWIMIFSIALIVLLFLFNFIFIRCNSLMDDKMKKESDKRMKETSTFINYIKIIKQYCWESPLLKEIYKIRDQEIKWRKVKTLLDCSSTSVVKSIPTLLFLETCLLYMAFDRSLTIVTILTVLAVFEMLNDPMTWLSWTIITVINGYVSLKRVQTFLNSPEWDRNAIKIVSESDDNIDSTVIKFENCNFSWKPKIKSKEQPQNEETNNVLQTEEELKTKKEINPEKVFHLEQINLNIKKGEFVAIVGKVGSGKSSLLSAINGEMELHSDSIVQPLICGSLGYSSQIPWIQNCSLKDNILFSREFDSNEFWEVVKVCGLMQDLESLPKKEETEIGERGINLSGGQKARVALARAIYANKSIYLFDDILSAVDAHVGELIFREALLKKLHEKTIILVTHNWRILPQVDRIIIMENGTIQDSGDFNSLMKNNLQFQTTYLEYMKFQGDDKNSIQEEKKEKENSLMKREKKQEKNDNEQNLLEEEDRKKGAVEWKTYKILFKYISIPRVIIIILFFFMGQGFIRITPILMTIYTEKVEDDSENKMDYFFLYLASSITAILFSWLAIFYNGFCLLDAVKRVHNNMLKNISMAPINLFFDVTPSGRILNRFSIDICDIDGIFQNYEIALNNGIGIICVISYCIYIVPLVSVLILILGICIFFFQRFYLKSSREIVRLKNISKSPVVHLLAESLLGVHIIKAFQLGKHFKKKANDLINKATKPFFLKFAASCFFNVYMRLLNIVLTFSISIMLVLSKDSLTPAFATLAITYSYSIPEMTTWLINAFTYVENDMTAFERCLHYTEIPSEKPVETPHLKQQGKEKSWPQKGIIEFQNYSLQYRPNTQTVLSNISAKILPKEKIGICGRTGAGKSSLTLGLLRIVEPLEGTIRIDGIDITKIGLHSLRSKVSIIPQDSFFFESTIRRNVDPFNNYSDEEIWNVLSRVGLKNMVESNNGLEMEIKEAGANISVGERQLICVARALLRKSEIVILDEATSSLDGESDSLIQTIIKEEFKESTVLTIAHRVHTVMDYDRILVLEKGQIVEFDKPQVLLQNQDSFFYGLVTKALNSEIVIPETA